MVKNFSVTARVNPGSRYPSKSARAQQSPLSSSKSLFSLHFSHHLVYAVYYVAGWWIGENTAGGSWLAPSSCVWLRKRKYNKRTTTRKRQFRWTPRTIGNNNKHYHDRAIRFPSEKKNTPRLAICDRVFRVEQVLGP